MAMTRRMTADTNSNSDIGFIPPSARRKVRARTIQQRTERRQSIILMALFVGISLVFVILVALKRVNTDYYQRNNIESKKKNLQDGIGERSVWVKQNSQPFNERGLAENAKHLVMVAGHSVTISGHLNDANMDEADWFLLDYQKGQGLPQAIHAHIAAGIEEARKDPTSLLIFSGGETRAISGPQTEAQAYYHVSDAMNLWPTDDGSSVRARTTTEEFATDSFENL